MNDIPTQKLHQQGLARIHNDTEQLRVNVKGPGTNAEPNADSFFQPESYYRAGATIKAGEPLSMADAADLSTLSGVADPFVVNTNNTKHKWCIGLSQEPGMPTPTGQYKKFIHVVRSGKFVFDWNDIAAYKAQTQNKDTLYANFVSYPPMLTQTGAVTYDISQATKFKWTYADVGKTVYVSNLSGAQGKLTLDISEAYADGGNILTVGHLADAPNNGSTTGGTQIVIEVQPAGDSRSLQDSTEFDAWLYHGSNTIWNDSTVIGWTAANDDILNTSGHDKLVQVKIIYGTEGDAAGRAIGIPIMTDAAMSDNDANSPIACFVAKHGEHYGNQTVVIHRLGIVQGTFEYNAGDVGKDLYFGQGNIDVNASGSGFEYKVGVIFDAQSTNQKVLVDCRYPKFIELFDPIGKIKPAYASTSGSLLTDPGYVVIDSTKKMCVKRGGQFGQQDPEYGALAEVILHQNVANFYNASGTVIPITNETTFANVNQAGYYFVFKDNFYKIGTQQVSAQIKYSAEGSPEKMQYVWPMKMETLTISSNSGGLASRDPRTTPDSVIKITDLVNLGENRYSTENSADDFEVQMILRTPGTAPGTIIPQGIFPIQFLQDPETITYATANGGTKSATIPKYTTQYVGYTWQFIKTPIVNGLGETTGYDYYLMMVTNPDPTGQTVKQSDCRGICWPGVAFVGNPPSQNTPKPYSPVNELTVDCLVRRRPAFYHSLMLNQLYSDSTWNADVYSDGANMGVAGSLFFGAGGTLSLNETSPDNAPYIDPTIANEFKLSEFGSDPYINNASVTSSTDVFHPITSEIHAFGEVAHPVSKVLVPTSKAVVRYYPRMENAAADVSRWEIDTTYDFEANTIEFSANLTGYWVSPATNPDSGTGEDRIEVIEPYIPTPATLVGLSKDNAIKDYRKALETLHELKPYLFTYNAEVAQYLHISPTANGIITNALNSSVLSNTQQSVFDETQTQFKGINALTQEGIKYSYNYTEEQDRIFAELNAAYLPDGDVNTGGIRYAYQSLQTNVGLLIAGAAEAQDRLLRLERVLFGADTITIPGEVKAQSNSVMYGTQTQALTDMGIMGVARLASWLNKFKFFEYDQTKTSSFMVTSSWQIVKDAILGSSLEDGVTHPVDYFYYPRWDPDGFKFSWLYGANYGTNTPLVYDPNRNKQFLGSTQLNSIYQQLAWLDHHLHANQYKTKEQISGQTSTTRPTDAIMMKPPVVPLYDNTQPDASSVGDYNGAFFNDHRSNNIYFDEKGTRFTLSSAEVDTYSKQHGLVRGFIAQAPGTIKWGLDGGGLTYAGSEFKWTASDNAATQPQNSLTGLLHDFAQRFQYLQTVAFDINAGINAQNLISRKTQTIADSTTQTTTDYLLINGYMPQTFKYGSIVGTQQAQTELFIGPKGTCNYQLVNDQYQWTYAATDTDAVEWTAFAFSKSDDRICQFGKTKVVFDMSKGGYIGTTVSATAKRSPVLGQTTIDWTWLTGTNVPSDSNKIHIHSRYDSANTSYHKTFTEAGAPEGYEIQIASNGQPTNYANLDKNIAISIDHLAPSSNARVEDKFLHSSKLVKPVPELFQNSYSDNDNIERPPNDTLVLAPTDGSDKYSLENTAGFDTKQLWVRVDNGEQEKTVAAIVNDGAPSNEAQIIEVEDGEGKKNPTTIQLNLTKPIASMFTNISTEITGKFDDTHDNDENGLVLQVKQSMTYYTNTHMTNSFWVPSTSPIEDGLYLRQDYHNKIDTLTDSVIKLQLGQSNGNEIDPVEYWSGDDFKSNVAFTSTDGVPYWQSFLKLRNSADGVVSENDLTIKTMIPDDDPNYPIEVDVQPSLFVTDKEKAGTLSLISQTVAPITDHSKDTGFVIRTYELDPSPENKSIKLNRNDADIYFDDPVKQTIIRLDGKETTAKVAANISRSSADKNISTIDFFISNVELNRQYQLNMFYDILERKNPVNYQDFLDVTFLAPKKYKLDVLVTYTPPDVNLTKKVTAQLLSGTVTHNLSSQEVPNDVIVEQGKIYTISLTSDKLRQDIDNSLIGSKIVLKNDQGEEIKYDGSTVAFSIYSITNPGQAQVGQIVSVRIDNTIAANKQNVQLALGNKVFTETTFDNLEVGVPKSFTDIEAQEYGFDSDIIMGATFKTYDGSATEYTKIEVANITQMGVTKTLPKNLDPCSPIPLNYEDIDYMTFNVEPGLVFKINGVLVAGNSTHEQMLDYVKNMATLSVEFEEEIPEDNIESQISYNFVMKSESFYGDWIVYKETKSSDQVVFTPRENWLTQDTIYFSLTEKETRTIDASDWATKIKLMYGNASIQEWDLISPATTVPKTTFPILTEVLLAGDESMYLAYAENNADKNLIQFTDKVATMTAASKLPNVSISYSDFDANLDVREQFLRTSINGIILDESDQSTSQSIQLTDFGIIDIIGQDRDVTLNPEQRFQSVTSLYNKTYKDPILVLGNADGSAAADVDVSISLTDKAVKELQLKGITAADNDYVNNPNEAEGSEAELNISTSTGSIRMPVNFSVHKNIYQDTPAVGRYMEPLWSKYTSRVVKSQLPLIIDTVKGNSYTTTPLWQPLNNADNRKKGINGNDWSLGSVQPANVPSCVSGDGPGFPVALEQPITVSSNPKPMAKTSDVSKMNVYFDIKDVMEQAKIGIDWYLPVKTNISKIPAILANSYWDILDGTPKTGYSDTINVLFEGGVELENGQIGPIVLTITNHYMESYEQTRSWPISRISEDTSPRFGAQRSGYIYVNMSSTETVSESTLSSWAYFQNYAANNQMYESLLLIPGSSDMAFNVYLGIQDLAKLMTDPPLESARFVKPISAAPRVPEVKLDVSGDKVVLTLQISSYDPSAKYEFIYNEINDIVSGKSLVIDYSILNSMTGTEFSFDVPVDFTQNVKYYAWMRASNSYGYVLHAGAQGNAIDGAFEFKIASAEAGSVILTGTLQCTNIPGEEGTAVSIKEATAVKLVSSNGNEITTLSTEYGSFMFSYLLPNTQYTVEVDTDKYSTPAPVTISTPSDPTGYVNIESQIELNLKAYEITVFAKKYGVPVEAASVTAHSEEYSSMSDIVQSVNELGSTVFNLRYGRYTFTAQTVAEQNIVLSNPATTQSNKKKTVQGYLPLAYCVANSDNSELNVSFASTYSANPSMKFTKVAGALTNAIWTSGNASLALDDAGNYYLDGVTLLAGGAGPFSGVFRTISSEFNNYVEKTVKNNDSFTIERLQSSLTVMGYVEQETAGTPDYTYQPAAGSLVTITAEGNSQQGTVDTEGSFTALGPGMTIKSGLFPAPYNLTVKTGSTVVKSIESGGMPTGDIVIQVIVN